MRTFLVTLSTLLCSSCSTQDLGGVATASAILVAAPLAPAAEAYHAIAGVSRTLTVFEVYRMKEGVYALSNDNGWFTDRSEQKIRGKGRAFYSAWVIDLASAEKDRKGRILLSEANLNRWFFRNTDVSGFARLPENPAAPETEYYTSNPGDDFLTLYTADRRVHVFYLPRMK